jgi:S1-C subfamily serine protease
LIAIAGGDDRTETAYPAAEAATRLMSRAAAGDRRASLGLSVQDLTGPLIAAFGDRGVLVTDVVPGGPADQVEVAPGDVLQAIDDIESLALGIDVTPPPASDVQGSCRLEGGALERRDNHP